jgi:hypothetical protein
MALSIAGSHELGASRGGRLSPDIYRVDNLTVGERIGNF